MFKFTEKMRFWYTKVLMVAAVYSKIFDTTYHDLGLDYRGPTVFIFVAV